MAEEKGLKLRTDPSLTFNVNFGYRIKNITIKAYQNNKSTENHDMSCSGFSVDGTTYNFDTAKEIPYNSESTSTVPVEISTGKISATSSVAFNFTNTNVTQKQIYAYITVEYEEADYSENFESTTVTELQSAWTRNVYNNETEWPGTYAPTFVLKTDECGQSSTWFLTYSGNEKRQTTAYYYFASAYTDKAYKFDARLNLNVGNTDSEQSCLYFMNGIKSGTNAAPTNYLFYIGVNSEGKAFISNGTDSDVSNIGGLQSGTNSIAATLWSKNYKSTGWFDASCIIDFENGTASVTVKNSSSTENLSISLKSGTKQFSGICVYDGKKQYGVVAMDDLALYELTYPAFSLSDTEKSFYIEDSETVTLTDITGDISVESDNTDVATVSYADGTITINGVAEGTATVTVTGTNDGFSISKEIEVTIGGYAAKYTAAKAPYDTKVANLDATGQAYWAENVTSSASVTNASEYSAAIAALPTIYVAAVKAQTTAGSDMTDAMLTDVATSSWTNATGTYNGVAAERYNGDTAYPAGNILYQTISGLHAGYYKVKFYGVANVARTLTDKYYGSGIAQMYANSVTQDVDVIYQDACSPISSDYLREFEVYLDADNSSIEFGIKNIKEGGQWYVAQALSLTYLGTEKNTYTINAVAGGSTIKELATGSAWASETYGVYVPKAILYNSKYYVLDDGENDNLSNYYASYTMGASNETKQINYTLDESIVAFVESGSNISQSTSNNSSYSSGNYGHVNGQKSISLGTLGSGIYKFEAYYVSNSNRGLYLRDGGNSDKSTNTIVYQTLSSAGLVSVNFQLASSTSVLFTGYTNEHSQYNQSAEFDYVLIRKLSVNDDPVVIGDINNATTYLGAMTDKVTLKPGESYRYQFVNHNANGSDNSKNWVLPVYANGANEATIVLRADNWEDKGGNNTGCWLRSNGSDNVWDDFINQMNGATVDMTVEYTTAKILNVDCDITTSGGYSWKYTYTSDYTGSTRTFTGDIDVALSVSLSWAEILSERQTTVAGTISASGWNTFSSNNALDLNTITGGTAYVASSTGTNTVTLTPCTDKVAAGTGLMIKGTPNAVFTINVTSDDATFSGTNMLVGLPNGGTVPANNGNYVFGWADPANPGFYFINSTEPVLGAGKAYLHAEGADARLSISFDDETTGVKTLNTERKTMNEFYDLQGRRVAQPTKGLYIVNGKKVVIRSATK